MLGRVIGHLLCWPKLQIERGRHDTTCDGCDERITSLASDRLVIQDDEIASADSFRELARVIWDADYELLCLPCVARENGDES